MYPTPKQKQVNKPLTDSEISKIGSPHRLTPRQDEGVAGPLNADMNINCRNELDEVACRYQPTSGLFHSRVPGGSMCSVKITTDGVEGILVHE